MWCVTLMTRCRLCGTPFKEPLCTDESGAVWKRAENGSVEDSNPWCPQCLERLNEACEALCAEMECNIG